MPPSDSKKISVILPPDLIRQIEDSGLTQTKAILEALKYYFSEDRLQIPELKMQIEEDAKKIISLEAEVKAFTEFRSLLEDQQKMSQAHISQVQTLITAMENERRSREEIIREKDEKILLLEDWKKKRPWYKFWG